MRPAEMTTVRLLRHAAFLLDEHHRSDSAAALRSRADRLERAIKTSEASDTVGSRRPLTQRETVVCAALSSFREINKPDATPDEQSKEPR